MVMYWIKNIMNQIQDILHWVTWILIWFYVYGVSKEGLSMIINNVPVNIIDRDVNAPFVM